MNLKAEKFANNILKYVSQIIQRDVKDNDIGFVTVTDVKVTNDLQQATIYVNFLGSDEREAAGLKALERSKGFIRSELAHKLEVRKVPELFFEIDNSLAQGNKIEQILKEIKDEDDN